MRWGGRRAVITDRVLHKKQESSLTGLIILNNFNIYYEGAIYLFTMQQAPKQMAQGRKVQINRSPRKQIRRFTRVRTTEERDL